MFTSYDNTNQVYSFILYCPKVRFDDLTEDNLFELLERLPNPESMKFEIELQN